MALTDTNFKSNILNITSGRSKWEVQLKSSRQDQLAQAEINRAVLMGHVPQSALNWRVLLQQCCQNSLLTLVLLISEDLLKSCSSWQWLNQAPGDDL